MIADIRTYFRTQINEIDATIQEWTRDVFGNNDVNKSQAQRFYNLVVGPITATRSGNSFTDEFEITLVLWSTSKRDIQDSFDSLYDKARLIRDNIICNISVVQSTVGFSDIQCLSITPSEEPSNDNTVRMEVLFTARVDFKF